jgi:hypothetical protein
MDDLRSTAAALIKCWETGNYGTISDCLADDFVEFDPPQRTSRGITDISEKQAGFHRVHSNVKIHIMKQIANQRSVCTHFLLLADVPTPGGSQPIQQAGMAWASFRDGKVFSHRVYRDTIGYLMQRGYRWDLSAMPQQRRSSPSQSEATA